MSSQWRRLRWAQSARKLQWSTGRLIDNLRKRFRDWVAGLVGKQGGAGPGTGSSMRPEAPEFFPGRVWCDGGLEVGAASGTDWDSSSDGDSPRRGGTAMPRVLRAADRAVTVALRDELSAGADRMDAQVSPRRLSSEERAQQGLTMMAGAGISVGGGGGPRRHKKRTL